MKIVVRDIAVVFLSLLVSMLFKFSIDNAKDDFFINTIYTVSGIMFSIGIGLIVTFNLQGIKNDSFIKNIRQNIKTVRNSYLRYFTFTTVIFILEKYLRENDLNIIYLFSIKRFDFNLNISIASCLFMFFSIFYYILNFMEIQKLNDDIFDKLNE